MITATPVTQTARYERDGFLVFRVSKTYPDGSSDFIEEKACPLDEAHAFFVELEEELIDRLSRALDRRHNTPQH